MLEVVDAEVDGLSKRHGAEMTGNLQSAFMGCRDHGRQLFACDVLVRFERGGTLRRKLRCQFVAAGRGRLKRPRKRETVEIWRGHVQIGARNFMLIDGTFQLEIRGKSRAAGRSDRCCTPGEIQPRKADAHRSLAPAIGREGEMLVRHHISRQNGAARQINDARVRRRRDCAGVSDF